MSVATIDSPAAQASSQRRISPKLRWALVLAVLAAIVAVWIFALMRRATEVTTVAVERGRIEETVVNTRAGTVRSRLRARLSPEIGGRVSALPLREGDRVQEGEIVLQIDSTLEKRRLELSLGEERVAKAQVKQACLAASQAERERTRIEQLAADRIVSDEAQERATSQAEQLEAVCEASRARLAESSSAVALSRENLEKTSLRAPFDGVIAEISVEVGEWTTPSPPALPVPPVIDLLSPEHLYVAAPIDEVDVGRLEVGQTARVVVDSHRDQVFEGRVTRIAPFVLDLEAQNRTVEVEVELEELPAEHAVRLLPGTSADVEILVQSSEGLRIPTAALYDDGTVLVSKEGRLERRTIEVGLRNWRFVEVNDGVREGERIVASFEGDALEPGARVKEAER